MYDQPVNDKLTEATRASGWQTDKGQCPGSKGLAPAMGASNYLKKLITKLEHKIWAIIISVLDWRCPCCYSSISQNQIEKIRSLLRPGDILLETNNSYPGWQIAVKLTLGSNWSHSAFYPGGNFIVDAGTRPLVAKIDLEQFLRTSHIAILRPHYETGADQMSASQYVLSCIGRPFNITFNHKDQKSLYCAQLISNALEQMPHPIRFGRSKMLWKEIVTPEDLQKNPQVDCLWSSQPTFWFNLCSHWPLIVAMLLGVIAGSRFGWLGSACGALVSVGLLAFIRNRLDKDSNKQQILF